MPTIQFNVFVIMFFHPFLKDVICNYVLSSFFGTVYHFLFSEYLFYFIWSVFPSYLPYSSSCVTGLKQSIYHHLTLPFSALSQVSVLIISWSSSPMS